MKCHKAQLLINKLLDGELQEAISPAEAHLANCPKCCQIYEDWQAINL
jgi:predicted anti-sigma-YlaC factor YlaD